MINHCLPIEIEKHVNKNVLDPMGPKKVSPTPVYYNPKIEDISPNVKEYSGPNRVPHSLYDGYLTCESGQRLGFAQCQSYTSAVEPFLAGATLDHG